MTTERTVTTRRRTRGTVQTAQAVARPRGARVVPLVLVACALVVVLPSDAWAWGPGTHIFLGDAVLRNLALLPGAVAALLQAHPKDFLYGSIAADTSIAKKYARFGRHCHSWNVGFEILEKARDEPLQAFAYGYLAHLAADAVAHNCFVPHQLAITASTSALGHSYWESRLESHLGERFPRKAREIIEIDHARSDGHLDRILSPTIFSTPTNRRIFRGMVVVNDNESWQRVFALMVENSRWDLTDPEVGRYLETSYEFVMDFLSRDAGSVPYGYDPSGEHALRRAKHVRRAALRAGGDEAARAEAQREFGLPTHGLAFARALPAPLYPPARLPSI
jgi:hypothetical protein